MSIDWSHWDGHGRVGESVTGRMSATEAVAQAHAVSMENVSALNQSDMNKTRKTEDADESGGGATQGEGALQLKMQAIRASAATARAAASWPRSGLSH